MKTPHTLYALQAWRAVAALLVVATHAYYTVAHFGWKGFAGLAGFGNAGVAFFFVLSGFIMHRVHAGDIGHPGRVGAFLRKRILRIYPVYWVVTLLLLPFWIYGFGKEHHREAGALIKSLLLWPQEHAPHLAMAWTLTHEMLFYLVFATLLLSRRVGIALATLWVAALLASLSPVFTGLFPVAAEYPATFFLRPYNLLFFVGILASLLASRFHDSLVGRLGIVLFVTGTVLMGVALWGFGVLWPQDVPARELREVMAYGVAAALLVTGSVSLGIDRFFAARRGLLFLGAASYAIYLVHWPAMSLAGKALAAAGWFGLRDGLPSGGAFAAFALVGVTAGAALHLVVERPLLARLRRLFRVDTRD